MVNAKNQINGSSVRVGNPLSFCTCLSDTFVSSFCSFYKSAQAKYLSVMEDLKPNESAESEFLNKIHLKQYNLDKFVFFKSGNIAQ